MKSLLLCLVSVSGLRTASIASRRAVVSAGVLLPAAAQAADDPGRTIRDAADALHTWLDNKDQFISALASGDVAAAKFPTQVPFAVFQKLEKSAEPEFMDIAIDYAEASRAARDLYKLAKLTNQPVEVSTKEIGKPRQTEVKRMGDTEAGLGSAKDYAERAAAELLGASLALDEAVKVMSKK